MAWLGLRTPVFALLPAATLLACDPAVAPGDDAPEPLGESSAGDESADDDDRSEGDTDGTNEPDDPGEEPGEEPGEDPTEDPTGDPPPPPAEPKPDAAVPCELDGPWGGYECTTADGETGTQFCILEGRVEIWTECSTEPPECEPGEGYDMGCIGEICYWDGEALTRYSWSEPDCNTPLVLDFEGTGIEFSPASAAAFDLSSNGTCMSTDWPTAPWLALDRDGDGFIRDGSELFGNATAMASGRQAEHGFAALAELDSNRDGKITAADERFDELVIWTDLDGDRIGAYAELHPLSELSLVSIDLGFETRRSCDAQGNCGFERSSFEYRTGAGQVRLGEVVDVHLACR